MELHSAIVTASIIGLPVLPALRELREPKDHGCFSAPGKCRCSTAVGVA